jgi:hypothetical protein
MSTVSRDVGLHHFESHSIIAYLVRDLGREPRFQTHHLESDVEGNETLPPWYEIKFFDGIEQVGNRRSGAYAHCYSLDLFHKQVSKLHNILRVAKASMMQSAL